MSISKMLFITMLGSIGISGFINASDKSAFPSLSITGCWNGQHNVELVREELVRRVNEANTNMVELQQKIKKQLLGYMTESNNSNNFQDDKVSPYLYPVLFLKYKREHAYYCKVLAQFNECCRGKVFNNGSFAEKDMVREIFNKYIRYVVSDEHEIFTSLGFNIEKLQKNLASDDLQSQLHAMMSSVEADARAEKAKITIHAGNIEAEMNTILGSQNTGDQQEQKYQSIPNNNQQ